MIRPDSLSRAEVWVRFAAAVAAYYASEESDELAKLAAKDADSLLKEFDKRFEWSSGGYDGNPGSWRERPKP